MRHYDEQLDKVLKIQLVNAFMMMIMGTRERLNMLIWVIVISIGFFGFKGGIFTITGGGGFHTTHALKYDRNGTMIWSYLYNTQQGQTVGYTIDQAADSDFLIGAEINNSFQIGVGANVGADRLGLGRQPGLGDRKSVV